MTFSAGPTNPTLFDYYAALTEDIGLGLLLISNEKGEDDINGRKQLTSLFDIDFFRKNGITVFINYVSINTHRQLIAKPEQESFSQGWPFIEIINGFLNELTKLNIHDARLLSLTIDEETTTPCYDFTHHLDKKKQLTFIEKNLSLSHKHFDDPYLNLADNKKQAAIGIRLSESRIKKEKRSFQENILKIYQQ